MIMDNRNNQSTIKIRYYSAVTTQSYQYQLASTRRSRSIFFPLLGGLWAATITDCTIKGNYYFRLSPLNWICMLHNFPLKCAHLWVSPPSPTSHRHRWLPQIALMHRSTHHWGPTRMSCRLIIRQNYDYADNYDARSAPLCVLSTIIIIIIICVLPQIVRQTDVEQTPHVLLSWGVDGWNEWPIIIVVVMLLNSPTKPAGISCT